MNGFHNSIGQVLLSLKPNAKWEFVKGTNEIEWLDDEQTEPTQAEIDAEVIRLEAEYDAQEYARNRASAYDSIGNQLDLLFHDMTAGKGSKTGEWYKAVKKVKTDNPKG